MSSVSTASWNISAPGMRCTFRKVFGVVESEPGTVAVNYWWRSLFSRELECDEIHLTTDYIADRVFRHLVMKGTKHKLTKICEFATDYYYGDGEIVVIRRYIRESRESGPRASRRQGCR